MFLLYFLVLNSIFTHKTFFHFTVKRACYTNAKLNLYKPAIMPYSRGGGGALPYMGYIGMCGPKGYGFSAVLVIKRVSNLADSGHK